jgi:hypothetical protein
MKEFFRISPIERSSLSIFLSAASLSLRELRAFVVKKPRASRRADPSVTLPHVHAALLHQRRLFFNHEGHEVVLMDADPSGRALPFRAGMGGWVGKDSSERSQRLREFSWLRVPNRLGAEPLDETTSLDRSN